MDDEVGRASIERERRRAALSAGESHGPMFMKCIDHFIWIGTSDYYRLLRAVTEKEEWEPWILYMLTAVEETALFTRGRIVAIRDLMEQTALRAKQLLPPRVYSKDLIELLFYQPYTKVQFLVDAGIAKRQAASSYLKELEQIGVLTSHKLGRENLYLNVALVELLRR
ncbi:MAG: hypothetical protein LLG45_08335 [Actinomycetia bacterium]|nr:hypothetical protein [Actinomycetes bacterium]